MTLKKFLIIPLGLSLAAFLYFSDEVVSSFELLTRNVTWSAPFVTALVAAVVLQLAGHIVRAYKMSYLLAPVKGSTPRFQFRALSVGYLFNVLLPFRLGELIRAQVIAGGEKISYGFALTLIIIERAIDAIVLALLGLGLLLLGGAPLRVIGYAISLLVVGILLLVLILMVAYQNLSLLRAWHKVTQLFNDNVKNGLRFKAWSVIYGLQRILSRKRFVRYLALTLLSWTFYVGSVLVLVQYFFKSIAGIDIFALTLSPYYGIALPAGPANLGVYSDIANTVSGMLSIGNDQRVSFDLVSWAVLLLPISLLGVVFLFTKTKETLWRSIPRQASQRALSDKLLRTEDVSQQLANFLDNYFSGNSLSQIVHKLELRHDFRLMKYFKGGSDAITILALQNNKLVVKKIIPIDFQDRLSAQYQWLRRREGNKGIVRALREYSEDSFYAIDLEYDEHNEMFFDFMHRSELAQSQRIFKEVWDHLHKSLYTKTTMVTDRDALKQYIDKHIFGCMDKAAAINDELVLAARPPKIRINGKQYHNLYQIMEKIMANKAAMRDLATYARSKEVHGDVAVDNILVSRTTGEALLIDPAPDGNIINGPVFDFAKNMQSLYCGYEFVFREEEAVSLGKDGKSINYHDQRSTRYMELCEYVRTELAPQYLSEGEQKAMLFHAGALHIRRLKHQVIQSPSNVLAIYAIGVKTLNDFLAQYE